MKTPLFIDNIRTLHIILWSDFDPEKDYIDYGFCSREFPISKFY